MTRMGDLSQAPPEAIESRIASTRSSLDAKLHELERRLSPRARLVELQERVRPQDYVGAAAAAAIAVGVGLAFAGWRRVRRESNLEHGLIVEGPVVSDVICK